MNEGYLKEVAIVWEAIAITSGIDAETTELMLKVAVGLRRVMEEEAVGVEEPAPDPAPAPASAPAPKPKKRLIIDWGKVGALHKAGWDVNKIADEMGASPLTIRNGISSRKWETYVGEDDEDERQED